MTPQLQNAENIARRMAVTTTGIDAAYWLIAAALLKLQQQKQNCKSTDLPHNDNKNLVTVR